MTITLEQAKNLKRGDVLYHVCHRNADGTPWRLRVTGKPVTYKTKPWRVCVPLKYGMYDYFHLYNQDVEREKGVSTWRWGKSRFVNQMVFLTDVCMTEEEAIKSRIIERIIMKSTK